VRPERRVGEELAQRVVLIPGRATDPDLHRPRGAGGVRDAGALRSWLRGAGRVGEEPVIALLLADPGEDLPRQLVPGADMLVDREHARRDVAHRRRRRRIPDPAAGAALADHNREHRRAAR
jgi:hypothetical protein